MAKPFLYLFILTKLKRNTKAPIVNKRFLKEHIGRLLPRRGGFPKFMIKYVIDDLVALGILEAINNKNLYRLCDLKEEKKVNAIYFDI